MISTKINEANWDRSIRVIVGIALIVAGVCLAAYANTQYAWGQLIAAIGLIPLFTGIIGYCPIYDFLKMSTAKGSGEKSATK